jgi:uncharacterized protein YegJ (DUF2314 family)
MESKVDSHKIEVERMWVEIIDKQDDFYIGTLDNNPCADVYLKCEQTIYFQSKHIIDTPILITNAISPRLSS